MGLWEVGMDSVPHPGLAVLGADASEIVSSPEPECPSPAQLRTWTAPRLS